MSKTGKMGVNALVIGFLILCFAQCMSSCGYPSQQYEYIQGPGGQQMVRVYDGGTSFMMEMAAFNLLMNSGGYSNVIHHYHSYPSIYPRYNSAVYGGWRSMPRSYRPPTYNPSSSGWRSPNAAPTPVFRNTTPAQSSGFRPSGSGYRPTFRSTSPTRSFSPTPSRSSGGSWRRR